MSYLERILTEFPEKRPPEALTKLTKGASVSSVSTQGGRFPEDTAERWDPELASEGYVWCLDCRHWGGTVCGHRKNPHRNQQPLAPRKCEWYGRGPRASYQPPAREAGQDVDALIRAACEGLAVTPAQFRAVCIEQDIEDIQSGGTPLEALRTFAAGIADGVQSGRIVFHPTTGPQRDVSPHAV
jgi:hypothetical protein